MMITGDKLETAENIGYLARLIREDFEIVRISSEVNDLRAESQNILDQIRKDIPLTVIIEGKQISKILEEKDPIYI